MPPARRVSGRTVRPWRGVGPKWTRGAAVAAGGGKGPGGVGGQKGGERSRVRGPRIVGGISFYGRAAACPPAMNRACKIGSENRRRYPCLGLRRTEAAMDSDGARQELSRRQVLSTAGLAAVAVPLVKLHGAPALIRRPDAVGAPGPQQVHVQFGADAASQVAVSWATAAAVSRPRLRLGRDGRGHGDEIPAEGRTYTEALTGETRWTSPPTLHGPEPHTPSR